MSDSRHIRNKGRFVVEPISEYLVFDIETTGLSPDYDEIIEFSGYKIRDGVVIDEYTTLIKPTSPIDSFIEELTGITNEMLDKQPTISEVIGMIRSFLGDSVLLGHNVHFDLNFIYDAVEYFNFDELNNDYIDLLRVSRRVHPEWKSHTLKMIAENLSTSVQPTHRSGNDALATYQAYELLKEFTRSNHIKYSDLFLPKVVSSKDTINTNTLDSLLLLNGEEFVFTGKLDRMERVTAWQLVVNNGGQIAENVSKRTNYLVLGNLDYSSQIKNGKSNKLKKAEEYILKGHDLKILAENVFYDLLSISEIK